MPCIGTLFKSNKHDEYQLRTIESQLLIDKIKDREIEIQEYSNYKLNNDYISRYIKKYNEDIKKKKDLFEKEIFNICQIENSYFLIDGREEIEVLKKIDNIDNINIKIQIKSFENIKDYKELLDLNFLKNPKKKPCYNEIERIFFVKSQNQLKKNYEEKLGRKFQGSKSFYSSNDFAKIFTREKLSGSLFLDENNQLKIRKIFKYLDEINPKIKEQYNNHLMRDPTTDIISKTKIYWNLKNLNLEELIQNEDSQIVIKPQKKPPPKPKINISRNLRRKVWAKRNKDIEGYCFVCKKKNIRNDEFECGHIIAHALGGKDEYDNLEPICRSCNNDMRIMNLNEYKDQNYPEN